MNSTSVDRLRRFVNRATDHSTCDLCRSGLKDRHRHVWELANRRMLCACDACAILFSDANGTRFRPIPESVTRINLTLSDEQWKRLGIPIGMAYFTVSDHDVPREATAPLTSRNAVQADEVDTDATFVRVGYPSPAGAVISSVDQQDWQALVDANPEVSQMQCEVESLLVNRTKDRRQAFVVPLDVCFELIGIVRRHWEGWSGGPELHREMDQYFEQLELSAGHGVRT